MATLIRNTSVMTMASVGQKVLSFIYFAVVARYIGADDLGKYTTALAFTTILVVFVDLGFTNVLVREVSRATQRAQEFLSTLLPIKLFLGLVTYIALLVLVYALQYETELRYMIMLSGVTMFFDSMHLMLYGVLRSFGTLQFEAKGIVASQCITLVLGTVFLLLELPLIFLILAFTIPSGLNVLYAGFQLRRLHGMQFRLSYNKTLFFSVASITVPFALAAIFARVYGYIDTLILQRMLGNVEVGWYGVAQKITYAFQFIPLALVAAVYPRLSAYYGGEQHKLAKLLEQSIIYLLMISVPIAAGIGVLAKPIILLVFGQEYLPAVLPLQILIASVVFSFVSFPLGAFLNACNKQATQTTIVGAVMVVNVALNLYLIPLYGPVGAAWAGALGTVLLTVLGYVFVARAGAVRHGRVSVKSVLILLSGSIMAGVLLLLEQYVHLVFLIILGGLVYIAMLFLFRLIQKRDVLELLGRL